MDASQVEALGLTVRRIGDAWEADFLLTAGLVNPLNQRIISKVTFAPMDERLVAVDPPDLVGLPLISLAGVNRPLQLEEQLAVAFDAFIFLLQRRSESLQSLGLAPKVNTDTLELSAEIQADSFEFTLVSDKRGSFRVAKATKDGKPLQADFGQPFDIGEFRERQALASYLTALVNEPASPETPAVSKATSDPILFNEVLERFGPGTRLPSLSSLELLVAVSVKGVRYRFAAARLMGRTFRGLLAGPQGKVWAERFELEEFPGVGALVASSLGVPRETVEVLGPEKD